MKILHTADWHLGHQMHGYNRYFEHQYFLDWLLDIIIQKNIDVLTIAGDIFDNANPSAQSWQQLSNFLFDLNQKSHGTQVIMIAGNHDSPSKINAPQELLSLLNFHFIGSVPRDENNNLALNRLLIPIKNKDGVVKGWCLAIPFLRSGDLILDLEIENTNDRWLSALKKFNQDLYQLAYNVKQEGQFIFAVNHANVSGGTLSETSERKIMLGGQHSIPSNIFHNDLDYVALGHLHLAQQIQANMPMFYSGSPLALSLSEKNYKHQVKILTWKHNKFDIENILTPKLTKILQIPKTPQNIEQVLIELENLPDQNIAFDKQDYLEVLVKLDKPVAQLQEKILDKLKNKAVRLAKITTSYTNEKVNLPKEIVNLDNITPIEVFNRCFQQEFKDKPQQDLLDAFNLVLTQIEEQE